VLTGGWPAVRLESLVQELAVPAAPEVPATRGYEALQGIRAQQAAAASAPAAPLTDPALRRTEVPRGRRHTDAPATAEQPTVQRPVAPARESRPPVDALSDLDAWPRPPAPLPPDPLPLEPRPRPAEPLTVQAPGVPSPGEARLAQILAESAAGAPRSGRRRHRYRDDDEDDDVLARVLGRQD
jgi:hypothetical protein